MTSPVLGGRPRARWILVALAVILAGGLSVWRGRPYWYGSPTVALGQAQDITIFGSAVIAAYAAWLSGHTRTLGDRLLAAPRSRHEIDRGSVLFAATAGVCGYGTLLGWMVVSGSRVGGWWGRVVVNPIGLASTVLMLSGSAVFWAGVGVGVGRWLPRLTALVLAPLVPYATFAVLVVYLSSSSLTGLALGGNLVYSSVAPTVSCWLSKAAFWLCLGAMVTAAVAIGRRRLITATAWATGLSAAVVIIGGSPLQVVASDAPVCRGQSPQVCVNAANRAVLSDYDREVRRLWARLPPSLRAPTVTDSVAAAQLGPISRGPVLVAGPIDGDVEPASTMDPVEFAAYFGDRAVGRACPALSSASGAAGALRLWWRLAEGLPVDGPSYPGASSFAGVPREVASRAHELMAMSDAAREDWVEVHLIDACPGPP